MHNRIETADSLHMLRDTLVTMRREALNGELVFDSRVTGLAARAAADLQLMRTISHRGKQHLHHARIGLLSIASTQRPTQRAVASQLSDVIGHLNCALCYLV